MTAIAKQEQFPIVDDWKDKIDILKKSICKDLTDDQFATFLHVAKKTGLDPIAKQIYGIPRGGVLTIQTSIDGFRLIAERTGRYAPGREPSYAYDKDGNLISATAYVKKQTPDGTWHEVCATAFWKEYVQTTKEGNPTSFWKKMAHLMLAKCAESLALRRAFPSELSNIYTKEEMSQAEKEEVNTSTGEVNAAEIMALIDLLEAAGVKTEKLDQFLEERVSRANVSKDKIITSALNKLEMFKDAYQKWLDLNMDSK